MTEHMDIGGRSRLVWPCILAASFFFIPIILLFAYPISFWCSTDNEPVGLANALNMAYRLADLRLYPAEGKTNHPGVQFYFMSWLALAFTGYPVAGAGQEFFQAVIDHADDYFRPMIYVAALVGAAGVYLFARTALKLIPIETTAVALLILLVSTPATVLFFMSPGYESVAILANSLFLIVLVRLALDRGLDPKAIVLAGLVGAFAYLNKLSYVYIPLALAAAIFCKAIFHRTGWLRGAGLLALFGFTFLVTIVATGYFVIGWSAFRTLLAFHKNVILGSGLYGTGSQDVVEGEAVRRAIMAIPGDKSYAIPLALIAGGALLAAGLVTGFRNRQNVSSRQNDTVAILSIGAGIAALFSAIGVLKHYESHYTAGVSAALPACVVAGWLFMRAWHVKVRFAAVAVAWIGILLMARLVLPDVASTLAGKSDWTRLASADMEVVTAQTAGMTKVVDYAYRVPFSQYGEGLVIHFAGVPRLTEMHLRNRRGVTNSFTEHLITEDVGAYVIDKNYFRDVEAVRNAPNVDLLGRSRSGSIRMTS